MDCPYPEPAPACDSKRFIEALSDLGNSNQWKYVGLVNVLHRFGKIDEVSDMIEKYLAFIHQHEADLPPPDEDEEIPPFIAGEFSASDEEEFLEQLRAPKTKDE